ncbi:MAG: hypothetical protein J5979_00585 [Lachnospiraceae bacterium]|nr:hypothetical protein [Lachnospiraceae bacterium]
MGQEKELVGKTLEQIEQNMELFYQQKTSEALGEFQQVLTELIKMVDILFEYRDNHDGFSLDEEKMKNALTEAMNALEEGDLILLADVIQYEFVEYVKELLNMME